MKSKVTSYLSVTREHRLYDFNGLPRRYWNRKLDIWIETIDVFTADVYYDFFDGQDTAVLELMVPRGDGYLRSVEQVQFPEHVAFIYDEAEA